MHTVHPSHLGTVRLFYDFLHLGGVVDYVAPRFVRLRRPWINRPSPLSQSQVKRLLMAARTPRERALIEFFYATGCRLGEIVRLKIEDIDFEVRMARVRGKLGKSRVVLLTPSAATAVRAYLGDRTTGIVFQQDQPVQKGTFTIHSESWTSMWREYRLGRKPRRFRQVLGKISDMSPEEARRKHDALMATRHLLRPFRKVPLSKMAVQEILRKMAERAGLRNVTPHTLRRTFATHLFENGAGIEIVQALLGHVWVSTTMKYARIGVDRLTKTFEQCHPREKIDAEATQPVSE